MRISLAAALLLGLPLLAQEHPDFSGKWTLNAKLSESVESKINDAAGGESVKGHTGFGPQGHPGFGIFPVTGLGKDVDRVTLRRVILDAVASLDRIEVSQTPLEIKHVDSQDNVRIFYLTREHVRVGRDGQRVKCHTEWQGEKLVITQEGDSVKLLEVLSRLPGRDQLVYSMRLENDKLKKPLELTLVYDPTPQ
jgi:hypothetical protein